MSDFRLKVISVCCQELEFYKGFAGVVYQPAGYNQAYPGAGGHLPDEAFRPAGK
mgnify:CR=1 FL=1